VKAMGCYKRSLKKGIRWYFSGQYLNQKYFSKAIYLSRAECSKAERIRLDELDKQARKPENDMFLKDLFLYRLDAIKLSRSNYYYLENRRYFKMFLDFTGNKPVNKISKADVYKFLMKFSSDLKLKGKDNWKANACLRSLKAAFNEAIDIHEIDIKNPVKGINFFPVKIKIKFIPPDSYIEDVKKICSPMQNLLIDFVDQTACRIMEAVRLKYSDIDGDKLTLYTRKSKNSNLTPRTIPLPDCLKGINGKGRIFTDWQVYPRFLEDKVSSLNQKRWNWHSLRHRRASMWANSGMTLIELQHRLGHNNMETTQRYLQLLSFTFR
jgi:integrase